MRSVVKNTGTGNDGAKLRKGTAPEIEEPEVEEEKMVTFLLRNVPAKRRDNFKRLKKARRIRSSMNDFIVDAFLAELEKYGG